jgi:hypothetical protein
MRRLVLVLTSLLTVLLGASPAMAADVDGDGVPNRRDRCPEVAGDRPDGCPSALWRLRNSNTTGPADIRVTFGTSVWTALAGDWDGNGTDTPGTFDPRTDRWRLLTFTGPDTFTFATFTFTAGTGRVMPIVGDWNGDGQDTIGLWEPATGTWYLRNSNSSGGPDVTFQFGGAVHSFAVEAVAGDWNGDGTDTVGLFNHQSGFWRLRNMNTTGGFDLRFAYSPNPDSGNPVVGDWDGDGDDTVGEAAFLDGADFLTWSLRNSNSAGGPDVVYQFGLPGAPVAGDWNGDGVDSAGVVRSR